MQPGAASPFVYRPPNRVQRPVWLRWLPPVALLASATAEFFAPEPAGLTFLVGLGPLCATIACGVIATGIWGVAAVLIAAFLFQQDQSISGIGLSGHNELVVIAGIGLASILITAARVRYDARLGRVSSIAEAVQYAVLPRLPTRVGDVRCAALYRSAERDALVGGDLFDVRATAHGVRAVIGDVKGHGLPAVSTMAALVGAFREAVLDVADLAAVAERLERRMRVDNADRDAELFATAVLFGFPPGGGGVDVVICGHPPPMLIGADGVRPVTAAPGPPIGLGHLVPVPPRVHHLTLAPGDTLLACTDGILEARDADGRYYPLAERLAALTIGPRPPLPRIVGGVWEDLSRFTEELRDDVALLAMRREDTPPD